MSIGPFALVSLLVADAVSSVVPSENVDEYIPAVMLLSLMIGAPPRATPRRFRVCYACAQCARKKSELLAA
eukprot:7149840-Prymnesium_polylepis.1